MSPDGYRMVAVSVAPPCMSCEVGSLKGWVWCEYVSVHLFFLYLFNSILFEIQKQREKERREREREKGFQMTGSLPKCLHSQGSGRLKPKAGDSIQVSPVSDRN